MSGVTQGYPTNPAARKRLRAANRERVMAEAEIKAYRLGRSYNCSVPGHHGNCIPENCLCDCHDGSPA